MTTTQRKTVRGSEFAPGMIIMFLGTPHLIDRIDAPSRAQAEMGARGVARAADGWGMTIFPNDRVEVA